MITRVFKRFVNEIIPQVVRPYHAVVVFTNIILSLSMFLHYATDVSTTNAHSHLGSIMPIWMWIFLTAATGVAQAIGCCLVKLPALVTIALEIGSTWLLTLMGIVTFSDTPHINPVDYLLLIPIALEILILTNMLLNSSLSSTPTRRK